MKGQSDIPVRFLLCAQIRLMVLKNVFYAGAPGGRVFRKKPPETGGGKRHSQFEILCMIQGSADFRIEQETFPATPGICFFIQKRELHGTLRPAVLTEPLRILILRPEPEGLSGSVYELESPEGVWYRIPESIVFFPPDITAFFMHRIQVLHRSEILREYSMSQLLLPLLELVRSEYAQLLFEVPEERSAIPGKEVSSCPKQKTERERASSGRRAVIDPQEIRVYLEAKKGDVISLKMLAQTFSCSVSSLCHTYRKRYGESIGETIRKLRKK